MDDGGRFGGAASLDGVSDRIDLPALGTFYKTGFTYEAWVRKQTAQEGRRRRSARGSVRRRPMIWVDHVAGRYHLTLGGSIRQLPRLRADARPSASGSTSRRPTTGATARFYVDGVQVASTTFTGERRQLEHVAHRRLRTPGRLLRRPRRQRPDLRPRAERERDPADMVVADPAGGDAADRDREDPGARRDGVNVGASATATFSEPMNGEHDHDLDRSS